MRGYPLRKLGPSDGTGEWKFSQTLNGTKMREKGREAEGKEERWEKKKERREEGRRKEGKNKRRKEGGNDGSKAGGS